MSDSAFTSAPFPSMTIPEMLKVAVTDSATHESMRREIERRTRAMSGDKTVMTPAERLRFATTGKAR